MQKYANREKIMKKETNSIAKLLYKVSNLKKWDFKSFIYKYLKLQKNSTKGRVLVAVF